MKRGYKKSKWWRRGESNPRPVILRMGPLHAYPAAVAALRPPSCPRAIPLALCHGNQPDCISRGRRRTERSRQAAEVAPVPTSQPKWDGRHRVKRRGHTRLSCLLIAPGVLRGRPTTSACHPRRDISGRCLVAPVCERTGPQYTRRGAAAARPARGHGIRSIHAVREKLPTRPGRGRGSARFFQFSPQTRPRSALAGVVAFWPRGGFTVTFTGL